MRNISSRKGFHRATDMIIAAGPAPVMCFVTKQSHPNLFDVLARTADQEGFGQGHQTFYISSTWEHQVNEAERALADMLDGTPVTRERVERFKAMRQLVAAVQQT